MAASEARLKANKKYHEKFDLVQFRVPKGEKKLICAHADYTGESLNSFLQRAVAETIANDLIHEPPTEL